MLREPILVDTIAGYGGIRAIEVVRKLLTADEMCEVDLAAAVGIPESVIRGILYRLYNQKVVSFRKEREANGWYVYHWTLQQDRLHQLVETRRNMTLDLLRRRLDYERGNHFFRCESGCTKTTFENAFENDFVCTDCGTALRQHDNCFQIEEINSYITRLEGSCQAY